MKATLLLMAVLPMTMVAQTERRDTVITVNVGYVSGSMNTLAGAVDKVTEERMNKGLVISSLDALSGQAAGVTVTSGGNQEAMVSAVRVRGTTSLTGANDPLVIIDGVTSDLATLSTIYPADIESFTILKDASETAQYGSRGAAGVIEVATKKGRQSKIESLKGEQRTMIFYESPYRVVKTLEQFAEAFGASRQVSVCREISKIHEESVRGTLEEVIAHFKEKEPKGEIVIVLEGEKEVKSER